MLGQEGAGFAPMQVRLGTRRIQMAAWSIGMAQRAMEMVIEYAPQRKTFGMPLSERQAAACFGVVKGATAHIDFRGGDLSESHLVHTIYPQVRAHARH